MEESTPQISPIPKQAFLECMKSDIFWITNCISVGPYPEEDKHEILKQNNITHILNVCEYEGKFKETIETAWLPIEDLKKIPNGLVIDCLETMHDFLENSQAKIYVHCVAGQNRSPNIIWLYLIACGLSPEEARMLISRATLDAVVGHPLIVDDKHTKLASKHGIKNFLPLRREEIILPSFL
ncbi:dual specificity protein phosphatase family protein [Candidatus Uabimicrobium sp. HlEnr_7]|uniref:dual specificity protein phosphatase family protein n=1 Tax=Candidatus Uabimicrobium helgolandensis TaxID=3095367 RepID=UPI003556691C